MRLYIGVTDTDWYDYLSSTSPEDVNFWQPGGNARFGVLEQGAPFLFKLRWPLNAIAGVGFFSSHTFLPISVAWDIFGTRNGCNSFDKFKRMILTYRSDKTDLNPQIGCIVLTDPIFFDRKDWIATPSNWSKSIVQGKSYSTDEEIGAKIWDEVSARIQKYFAMAEANTMQKDPLILAEPASPMYGFSVLQKVRRGQGAFRVLITDTYNRKCSITGEKTLPVLEAAHIRPYSESGPHAISNGLLLRSDMHKLFDTGYITITRDHKVEVSKRIKEEFQNGREYYQYHGKSLLFLPQKETDKPGNNFIDWHNNNVFRQ